MKQGDWIGSFPFSIALFAEYESIKILAKNELISNFRIFRHEISS